MLLVATAVQAAAEATEMQGAAEHPVKEILAEVLVRHWGLAAAAAQGLREVIMRHQILEALADQG